MPEMAAGSGFRSPKIPALHPSPGTLASTAVRTPAARSETLPADRRTSRPALPPGPQGSHLTR